MAESPQDLGTAVGHAPVRDDRVGGERLGARPDIDATVVRARAAQRAWGAATVQDRVERLRSLLVALVDDTETLVDVVSRESGKPRLEALMHEVMVLAMAADYYVRNAATILAPVPIEHRVFKHRRSYTHYSSRGVVAVIGSWSFPVSLPFTQAIAALAAGNAVIVKPNEHAQEAAEAIQRIVDQSDLPEGLLQLVSGGAHAGHSVIEANPDFVVFTGKRQNAKRVAEACGARLIPHSLHVGGSAPAIVCCDADVERTARAIVFGAIANSGQTCASIERVYVHREIAEAVTARVVALVEGLRVGDPSANTTDVGPMTMSGRVNHLALLVRDAIDRGATLLTGGDRAKLPYFCPTVISGCDHTMRVMTEEVLGPIVPIMEVDSDAEAIEFSNRGRGMLAAYVFSRDRGAARRIAEQVRAGSVVINDALSMFGTPEAALGGVGAGGSGHIFGPEGLKQMCELRQVNYGVLELSREALWFPYGEGKYTATAKAARLLFRGGSAVRRVLDLL